MAARASPLPPGTTNMFNSKLPCACIPNFKTICFDILYTPFWGVRCLDYNLHWATSV